MLLPLHGILLLSIRNSEQMPELCAYWALPFRYALVTFAPVSTNAIILPLSLHARLSLKAWPLRHYADELKKVCKQAKERCYIIMYSTGKGNVLRKQCQEIRREIKENMKCTGIKKGLQSR